MGGIPVTNSLHPVAPVSSPSLAQTVYIARQPIFDSANQRIAYELLYRENATATSAGMSAQDVMCSDTALHAVVSIGLDRLTDGALAYVNVTREHLLGALYKVLDPSTVVLELLESIEPDDDIIAACQAAVDDGYTLALDDYDGRPSLDVLLPFVRIVKLDVLGKTADDFAETVRTLRERQITVLAERIETTDVLEAFRQLGCQLYQGYLFSRPQTFNGRAITAHQAALIRIMGMLNQPAITDSALDDAFSAQPTLTYALLRIVNSASFGGRSIDSIGHAIRLIGRASLSRWLMVMLVSSVAQQGPVMNEMVLQALIRGRFCELLTVHNSDGDPSARFLVGMLSCIDLLLGLPLTDVLERLPVNADVRNALLRNTGPHAQTLAVALAYDGGRWDEVDSWTGGSAEAEATMTRFYSDAVQWAKARLTGE